MTPELKSVLDEVDAHDSCKDDCETDFTIHEIRALADAYRQSEARVQELEHSREIQRRDNQSLRARTMHAEAEREKLEKEREESLNWVVHYNQLEKIASLTAKLATVEKERESERELSNSALEAYIKEAYQDRQEQKNEADALRLKLNQEEESFSLMDHALARAERAENKAVDLAAKLERAREALEYIADAFVGIEGPGCECWEWRGTVTLMDFISDALAPTQRSTDGGQRAEGDK